MLIQRAGYGLSPGDETTYWLQTRVVSEYPLKALAPFFISVVGDSDLSAAI
jgi:hypothetical protein